MMSSHVMHMVMALGDCDITQKLTHIQQIVRNSVEDSCELPRSKPRIVRAVSVECPCSVGGLVYYLQPTHKAICGSRKMFVLAQRGRHQTIPKTPIVVAKTNNPQVNSLMVFRRLIVFVINS